MTYPHVIGELTTLAMVLKGFSLARYGDGEFNLCAGRGAKRQRPDPVLGERLREMLQDSGACLVGLPNLHSKTPKAPFWQKYLAADRFLVDRPYVSAFVTRPDSAPWIDTPEYWTRLEALWKGQSVTLVRGSEKSFTADRLRAAGAREVCEIVASETNAWSEYLHLLEEVGTPTRALLCLGPTATVMAVDLCARGVHAIDMGHCGMFYEKHRRGESMVVTDEDKAA